MPLFSCVVSAMWAAASVACAATLAAPPSPGVDDVSALSHRVDALDTNLAGFLSGNGSHTANAVHLEGDAFMKQANGLVAELINGGKAGATEAKGHLLQRVVRDLQTWESETAAKVSEGKKHMKQVDADYLMKMLIQRKSLPLPTQLAVLKRTDVADLRWAQELLKNHTDSAPLSDQLRDLLARERVASRVTNGLPKASEHSAKAGAKIASVKMKMAEVAQGFEEEIAAVSPFVKNNTAAAADLATAREELQEATATGVHGETTLTIPARLKVLGQLGKQLRKLSKEAVLHTER